MASAIRYKTVGSIVYRLYGGWIIKVKKKCV